MQNKNFTIKTATRKEVDIAVDWAAEEGWNPGLLDADCYYAADPQGFFIGFLGADPIATISAVRYSDTFGFLGFYIVKPEYRGQGYGLQIWNRAIRYMKGCNIGLDGVVAQQDNYKKSGFRLAFCNARYEGPGGGEPPGHAEIRDLTSLSSEAIIAYDRPFFPADRAHFLKAWINQPQSTALGITQGGKLAGYGVIRPCRTGYKVGPLFADSPELAESLFLSLKSTTKPSEPVYLDIPEVNQPAEALAKRHNMKVMFETARMYTGQEPAMPLSRLFGITSFEIG